MINAIVSINEDDNIEFTNYDKILMNQMDRHSYAQNLLVQNYESQNKDIVNIKSGTASHKFIG